MNLSFEFSIYIIVLFKDYFKLLKFKKEHFYF